MNCKHCGAKLNDNEFKCKYCGCDDEDRKIILCMKTHYINTTKNLLFNNRIGNIITYKNKQEV